jgi:hypothetical protein
VENSLVIGLIVFAVIMAGALAGLGLSQVLPAHHLSSETQSLVSLSMAVVATVSALVLGLLISNANNSFATYGREVTELSAEMLRLDRLLRHYGPEADSARELLQQYASRKTVELFPDDPAKVSLGEPATYNLLERAEDAVLALKPATAREQWLIAQALTDAAKIGEMRWILRQQVEQETPGPVVGLLVFWLTVLFGSFGLFAPRNIVSAITLTLCAMAVAGAVGMMLELEKGFGGMIHVSPEPMRQAVAALQAPD